MLRRNSLEQHFSIIFRSLSQHVYMCVCVFCVCLHIYMYKEINMIKIFVTFCLDNTGGHGVAFSVHVALFIAVLYFPGICVGWDTLKEKAVKLPAQSDNFAFCTLWEKRRKKQRPEALQCHLENL